MERRRVAIYGGTFDPVHRGHLEVARRVRELFDLDEVLFVPAFVPPHKRDAGILSPFHRVAMLALAIQDDDRFQISTIELDQPERPYAIDTVSRLKTQLGAGHRFFFLIGADSWAELHTWHQWRQLLNLCDLIVVTRPGYELRANVPAEVARIVDMRGQSTKEILAEVANEIGPRVYFSDGASMDVSATAIRAAASVNDEAALQKMLPPAVANYITKHQLYGN
jgi:nicotinate-nucleotide adenylyltransferase